MSEEKYNKMLALIGGEETKESADKLLLESGYSEIDIALFWVMSEEKEDDRY